MLNMTLCLEGDMANLFLLKLIVNYGLHFEEEVALGFYDLLHIS